MFFRLPQAMKAVKSGGGGFTSRVSGGTRSLSEDFGTAKIMPFDHTKDKGQHGVVSGEIHLGKPLFDALFETGKGSIDGSQLNHLGGVWQKLTPIFGQMQNNQQGNALPTDSMRGLQDILNGIRAVQNSNQIHNPIIRP